MYIVADMIDLGIVKGQVWTSPYHRRVAQNVCLCNPNIITCDQLVHNCGIINQIPKSRIKKATFADLRKLGCHGID